MDEPFPDKVIRKRRESHGAVMLVALLMAMLLLGAALVALENLEFFKATTPTDPPLTTDKAAPTAPL